MVFTHNDCEDFWVDECRHFPTDAQTPLHVLDEEQNPPHHYWQRNGGYIKVASDFLAII